MNEGKCCKIKESASSFLCISVGNIKEQQNAAVAGSVLLMEKLCRYRVLGQRGRTKG